MQSLISQITNLFATQSLNSIENNELLSFPALNAGSNSEFSGLFENFVNEASPANIAALNGNPLQSSHTPISFEFTQFTLTAKPGNSENAIEYSGQIANASIDGNIKNLSDSQQIYTATRQNDRNDLIFPNFNANLISGSNRTLVNDSSLKANTAVTPEGILNSFDDSVDYPGVPTYKNQAANISQQLLGGVIRDSSDVGVTVTNHNRPSLAQETSQSNIDAITQRSIIQNDNTSQLENDVSKHTALIHNSSIDKPFDQSLTAYSVSRVDEKQINNAISSNPLFVDNKNSVLSDSDITGKSNLLLNENSVDKPISSSAFETKLDARFVQADVNKINHVATTHTNQVEKITSGELGIDQQEIVEAKHTHNIVQQEEVKRFETSQRDESVSLRSNVFDQDRHLENVSRLNQRNDVAVYLSSPVKLQENIQDVKLSPNNVSIEKAYVTGVNPTEHLNVSNKTFSLDKSPLKLDAGNGISNGEDLAQQIAWAKSNNANNIKIAIAPEHLGALEIDIESDVDGLNIQFITQNTTAKEALETFMPRLKDMLEQNGLNLQNANVSQQDKGQSQSSEYQDSDEAILQSNNNDQSNLANDSDNNRSVKQNNHHLLEAFA